MFNGISKKDFDIGQYFVSDRTRAWAGAGREAASFPSKTADIQEEQRCFSPISSSVPARMRGI